MENNFGVQVVKSEVTIFQLSNPLSANITCVMDHPSNVIGECRSPADIEVGSIEVLSDAFLTMADRLVACAVEPMRRGLPPDEVVVSECLSLASKYKDSVERVGLPHGTELSKVMETLRQREAGGVWARFLARALPSLAEIALIVHTSGSTPVYLSDIKKHASLLIDELRSAVPDSIPVHWEARVAPFRALMRLLTEAEALSDDDGDALVNAVQDSLGRAVVSAVVTRKLVVVATDTDSAGVDIETAPSNPVPSAFVHSNSPIDASLEIKSSVPTIEVDSPVSELGFAAAVVIKSKHDSMDQASQADSALDIGVETPGLATMDAPNEVTNPPDPSEHVLLQRIEEQLAHETKSPTQVTLSGLDVRAATWELLGKGRCGLAYQIAKCWADLGQSDPVEPPAFFRAAAMSPFIRSSFGDVVDGFRVCVTDLVALAGSTAIVNESAVARRLVLFGLALRPALLAPAAGATSVLQAVDSLDTPYPAIARVRQAVVGFGAANLELNASVLKGVREKARWQSHHRTLVEGADTWLKSNRMASIKYAPATEVWHRWLREGEVIGRAVTMVVADRRADRESVMQTLRDWRNRKWVEKQITVTDCELRKQGARRKPIEGPPVVELCDRVEEGVRLVDVWVTHIEAEPQVLDVYRQRRADEVRGEVVSAIPAALSEVGRVAGGTAFDLQAAAAFVARTLNDLQRLFDPAQEENSETPPLRVLLGEELLAVPRLALGDDWCPEEPTEADLGRMLALRLKPYDQESAFRTHAELRNHVRTNQVIEALQARGNDTMAGRLRESQWEDLRGCRKVLKQELAATRANIEQAVCYDLIDRDSRARHYETVQRYERGLDDELDFDKASTALLEINNDLAAQRDERVAFVQNKLDAITRDGVPIDRQADVEVVRTKLREGDFLSAEEYLELFRSGQPLVAHSTEADRSVFREFFAGTDGRSGFVRRFDEYMNGPDKPSLRDVADRIRKRESVGPIDMRGGADKGVPEPQAKGAAAMVEAWIRLKESKDRTNAVSKELVVLLTGFGFEGVAVESVAWVRQPHWLAVCRTAELKSPEVCIIPQYGSLAEGKYRFLGVYDRPNEESLVELAKELPGTEPLVVLYFGRMTEQRRRDLAEFSRARGRGFLTVDESLVLFLCGERFSRLPILFQCTLPFTVAKPYTTTASLVPIEMFFGREQERNQLTAIDGTNLVYGGRQLGKSALLRDIERRSHNSAAGQIVRWIDLKNRGIGIDQPTDSIWVEMGRVLHADGVIQSPATTHETVTRRVKEWLNMGYGRRILLLLDEADGFFEMDSKASGKGQQSYPEVARLKGLMDDTNRRFKVVFAGLHNVQRAARDPNTPLGHLGTPVCIGPLLDNGEWKQARKLIEVPLRHMGFELNPANLWMRILSYTNYYPSLIQVFCKHMLETLQSKDQTTFDFRRCPPYTITADQIERVYQSAPLRQEVLDKFELTLGLDPRYRLIALEIAFDSLNPGGSTDGVDVAWVRTQALADWPNGFAETDRGHELFRTILDEMVGLGILRRSESDRYALRSPNVLNLLGSRDRIESKLLDVMELPRPLVYNAATFRRSLGGDRWQHSPFTAEQEAALTEAKNGVAVVFASRLAGLDRLTDGLRGVPNVASVQVAGRMTQPAQLQEWLHQTEENRLEGVTIAVVGPDTGWTADWVRRAADYLRPKTRSAKRFLRVVFIADPSSGWSWMAEEDMRASGAIEITVRPWHETALQRWIEDVEFNNPHHVCEALLSRLGGWYSLVNDFSLACRDNPHSWNAAIDAVTVGWPNAPQWAGCCDIPREAHVVLKMMAEFSDPLRPKDLEDLTGSPAVHRVLVWADRFAYIHRADDENGERWTLDPIIRIHPDIMREA